MKIYKELMEKVAKAKRHILFGNYDNLFIANDIDNSRCYTFKSFVDLENWVEEHI